MAKKVATDIIRFGKVRRGYMGVKIQNVDATMAKANGLSKPMGVFVQEVTHGSAGESAGVKDGDIILTIDGKEVNTSNMLQTIIASKNPGESVTLKIFRSGKSIEKKVVLKPRDEAEEAIASNEQKDETDEPSATNSKTTLELGNLGMTVRNLDAKTKKDYGVENGIIVAAVEPLSEANKRNILASDVIVSVGDQPVTSITQFEKLIKAKKAGDALLMRVKGADKSMKFVAIEVPEK
jgi:serine protease Do